MGDSGRRSSWLLYKRRRRFRRLEAIPLQYSREKSSIPGAALEGPDVAGRAERAAWGYGAPAVRESRAGWAVHKRAGGQRVAGGSALSRSGGGGQSDGRSK